MPRPVVKSRKTTQPRKNIPVPVPDENTESEYVEVTPDLHLPELPDLDNAQPDLDLTQMDEPEPAPSTSTASTSAFVQPPRRGKKKTNRVSHSDIPNYPFTDEQVDIVRNFIQTNPALYHKRDREYSNHKTKFDLWHKCADLFPEGGPTWLQCRKFFEQKRTAYGKIESVEMRSGSARRERTPREETLMEEWSFLKGHITHLRTRSSQSFNTDNDNDTASSGNESAASVLSAHSIARREIRKKSKRPSASSHEPASSHGEPDEQQDEVDLPTIRTLINRAQTMTEENQEPWVGTKVYHFTKMIGHHVYELPPPERNEAMQGAMAYVLGLLKRSRQTDAECQTTPPPHVVDAAPPPPRLQPVPPSPLRAANPGQPTILHGQPLQQPQIIQGAPPLYSGPVQYAPPHTPGNWVPQPPLYYQPAYQPLPPTSTAYQPAPTTVTHSTGAYHILQSSQQPSTSGYVPATTSYVPATTSYVPTTTTSASLQSSPSGTFFETLRDVYPTTASSMHTPQGSGGEEPADNN